MARKIKLHFRDKTYIIEYSNRSEVLGYFSELNKLSSKVMEDNGKVDVENLDVEGSLDALKLLLKAGLVEHHKDDMPSDKDLENWVLIIPNATKFYETLMSMVQDVISTIEDDTKNVSWEVEEA